MDDYWKKFGEELKIKKHNKKTKSARRVLKSQQLKLDKKFENNDCVRINKSRWPLGSKEVYSILEEHQIRFNREKVVGLDHTFRQVDFAIQQLKVFIEIDGPEHIEEADKFREQQILNLPLYQNWRFFRIKSHVAADVNQCRMVLQPLVDEWAKLPHRKRH